MEELLGLEQPQEPPTAQGRLDVIVEETTETTVMMDEEAESEATSLGGPTGDATAPVRETEQDMETEGDGGNSPVTPNEDDLLTGAGAGTHWPGFQPTIVGVGKKTWTFIWGPILGSITERSQPPSGPN